MSTDSMHHDCPKCGRLLYREPVTKGKEDWTITYEHRPERNGEEPHPPCRFRVTFAIPDAYRQTVWMYLLAAAHDAAAKGRPVRLCVVTIDTGTDRLAFRVEYDDGKTV